MRSKKVKALYFELTYKSLFELTCGSKTSIEISGMNK